ncbi:MAG: ABC transporter permease subunit [Myxococcales bacterium]|nr:ABC transporter permease subunit [Myxococcales bacterium]
MTSPRTIGLVAGFELYESLRSRKAVALLLLYLVIALGGTAIFASLLNSVYDQLADQLGAKLGPKIFERLAESDQLVKLVSRFVGNDEGLARELLTVPPLAVFYGWLITSFMPLIVVLSSADAISSEVASGSARFALFRIDRLGWTLGKLLGQTLLMVLGIAIGAVACWGVGVLALRQADAMASAYWLARMSFRGAFYGFAYLGIAMCASQLVRGNAGARALGIGFALLVVIFGNVLGRDTLRAKAPALIGALHRLFPNAHDTSLFQPALGARLLGSAALVGIGLLWFTIGYWRFARRDA